ncbi:MAG: hypothetical protein BWK79_00115 [Beggiatoa sp. IS2]|nr:MAG: hypothetical protein BWK78_00005 [Thiotrichaceae bacterium IS1]OQW96058.1 MAG: hypothetical protein BWK79_00115 [Beggiatoa sp. IS2]
MSYTSKDEIISFYDAAEMEDVTDAHINLIINQTDELINSYLAPTGRYLLPLDPVPNLIKTIATDIARWEVVSDGRIYDELRLKGLETRYNNGLKLLQAINAGTLSLNGHEQSNAIISYVSPARIFTQETLESF